MQNIAWLFLCLKVHDRREECGTLERVLFQTWKPCLRRFIKMSIHPQGNPTSLFAFSDQTSSSWLCGMELLYVKESVEDIVRNLTFTHWFKLKVTDG